MFFFSVVIHTVLYGICIQYQGLFTASIGYKTQSTKSFLFVQLITVFWINHLKVLFKQTLFFKFSSADVYYCPLKMEQWES